MESEKERKTQMIEEPLQPQQIRHGKMREPAGWHQKIVFVFIGIIVGAALVAGGYAMAGNHSTTNLAPLQRQVTALEHDVNSDNAKVTSSTSRVTALNSEVFTLQVGYDLLKADGITTYNETCPIGGAWVPCAAKEPPGFNS
jgi:outer membrane murein-binding lipoprotein Lpp